jgi:peptide/nickel transport system permease protein
MWRFILQRLASMVPVVLLVSVVVFSLILLLPGDPAVAMLGDRADPALVAALRRDLGLDRPPHERYLGWLGRALQGDLGRSLRNNQPVAEAVVQRLPVTLQLSLVAMLISLSVAVPIGIISATRPGSKSDVFGTVFALLGVSIPHFWLGVVLIFVFAVSLRWLPPSGYLDPMKDPLTSLSLMILPGVTLGLGLAGVVRRMVRSSLLEVLDQDYIRTAWAKGLAEQVVVGRHAFKNALIPVITVIGLQVGRLFAGAVITETVFAIPGVGRLVVDSIFARDFPVVQGAVLMMALAVLVTNLVVDILYAYVDPRIRFG